MNRENTEQEVLRLADAWATAELRGDTTFLERTLADDFIGIGPLGFMLTRQEWLARHTSGDLKYESFNLDQGKVRMYNDAAVFTGRQIQNAVYRGNSTQAHVRTTPVLLQKQAQRRPASLQ